MNASTEPDARAVQALCERLFTEYERPLLNYLYRLLGDPSLAEDLTQETFTRAWHARHRLFDVRNPRAWLYRIATNLARDHIRRARLLAWLPFFADEDHEPALLAKAPEGDPIEAQKMRRALLKLSEEYRALLVLYICQSFSVAEIAATLNLSTDAVKQRPVRARRQLREAYERL
ncbi:MAG: RNA polymerase sigma factor [Anaerolineales bacterium]|nr:RNA polymerase sigma factor [Anaerolineales bacterium]